MTEEELQSLTPECQEALVRRAFQNLDLRNKRWDSERTWLTITMLIVGAMLGAISSIGMFELTGAADAMAKCREDRAALERIAELEKELSK